MTTTSATTAATAPAATAPSQKSAAATASLASDFDTFLKLLTAQLKSQDPLAPLDATQFVEQLATFSSVEQQIQSNTLLAKLVEASNGGVGLDGATQWIGKEVEAEASTVQYSGDPLSFEIDTQAQGTPSEVVVRNSSGDVVYRKELGDGQTSFTFDGLDEDGNALAYARYSLEANYELDGEITDTKALRAVARVTEARISDGAVSLVLDNGAVIDPGAVTAVREAG